MKRCPLCLGALGALILGTMLGDELVSSFEWLAVAVVLAGVVLLMGKTRSQIHSHPGASYLAPGCNYVIQWRLVWLLTQ